MKNRDQMLAPWGAVTPKEPPGRKSEGATTWDTERLVVPSDGPWSQRIDLEGCVLLCGDSLEILPVLQAAGGTVDAVVTDPPYGINTKSDGSGKLSPWADLCNSALWYREWLGMCRPLARLGLWSCLNWRSMVTFQKAACDLGWPLESMLVWDKQWIGPGGTRGLRPSYEMLGLWLNEGGVIDRGTADVQPFPWSSQKPHGHPAEKPAELMRFCIDALGARSVLDPFMGSGTTGDAAISSGATFIGIEQDPAWFEVAASRLRNKPRMRSTG